MPSEGLSSVLGRVTRSLRVGARRPKRNEPMKVLSRLLLAPPLAAAHACTSTIAARRIGGSPYDGTWSVAIYTSRGNCGSVRVAARIVGGRVYSEDQSYQANGGVGANGVVPVTVSGFGRSAAGSGRLSHNSGAGRWRSSRGECSGTWSASRRASRAYSSRASSAFLSSLSAGARRCRGSAPD
jgi:hypothetical protein